jgi:membrane associated rhomboid family serine protease
MLVRMAKLPVASRQEQRDGLIVLAGIVALMWVLEAINTIDSNHLSSDGIYARDIGRSWGIVTAPFLHVSFQHLIDNTVPFLFMGVIIALRGAARLLVITALIILIGGVGTWLISPSGVSTVGASGVVFGYATYLLARGFFDRNFIELLIGALVGVVWGGALLNSLLPHGSVSWQGHLSGAIGGVVAAWFMARHDGEFEREAATT